VVRFVPVPRETHARNRCLVTAALPVWARTASSGDMAMPLAAAMPAFRRSRRDVLSVLM